MTNSIAPTTNSAIDLTTLSSSTIARTKNPVPHTEKTQFLIMSLIHWAPRNISVEVGGEVVGTLGERQRAVLGIVARGARGFETAGVLGEEAPRQHGDKIRHDRFHILFPLGDAVVGVEEGVTVELGAGAGFG